MSTKRPTARAASAKGGRPSTYTRAIADEICRRIAEGEPLTKICRSPNMPAYSTILGWRVGDMGDGEFSEKYARARQDGADALADKIRELAERVETGKLDPNAGRVAIDALKWIASKLKPRSYGDKLELAGKVGTLDVVDQAPDWLKAAIKEKAAEVAAAQEAGAPAQGDGDRAGPEGKTVH